MRGNRWALRGRVDMLARVIEPFCEDLWTVARPQKFWGVECGTRMTVVRLADGGLFLHCPVALDPELKRDLDALGPVRAVVAPSLFHHLYVGDWMKAYPEASFSPCPGLREKRPDLAWGEMLGEAPRDAWAADLDQAPLTARFEREIVFFHRRSRTFLCADALLNLRHHPSRLTRIAAVLMGNDAPGKGYLERIAIQDRPLCRRQIERILDWDIDGALLAHGDLVPHGGKQAIIDAYAWV